MYGDIYCTEMYISVPTSFPGSLILPPPRGAKMRKLGKKLEVVIVLDTVHVTVKWIRELTHYSAT